MLQYVDTFLQVVRDGTLSSAAKNLYVSQSTISNRLKLLETELGTPIFHRNKGQKQVELTPAGEQLLILAQEMMALERDILSLKKNAQQKILTIGSVDSINNHTFIPCYLDILSSMKNLSLEVKTHHSNEIHELLNNQIIDIGFVFSRVKSQNIIVKHLYSENMVLLSNWDSPYGADVHVANLKRKDEVYLSWNPEFVLWHNNFWHMGQRPYVTVNTGSMIKDYLIHNPNAWTIVPKSVSASLIKIGSLKVSHVTPRPPEQHCFQVTSKYPKVSRKESIQLFTEKLYDYLKSCDWIHATYSLE